jgi:hypothetical protein
VRLTWLNEGFCDFTLLRIRHGDPFVNSRWLQLRHQPAFFNVIERALAEISRAARRTTKSEE